MRPLKQSLHTLTCANILVLLAFSGLMAEGPRFWLDGRIGANSFGGSFQGSVSFQTDSHLLTARYIWAGVIHMGILGTAEKDDEAEEFALMYGRVSKRGHFQLSVSGGIAYVDIKDYESQITFGGRPDYRLRHFEGFGFPAEADVAYRLARWFAISTSLFASFNEQKTLLGFGVGARFGELGSSGR